MPSLRRDPRHDVGAKTGRRQAVIGPPLHEIAAKLDHVAALVGALDAAGRVRKRRFS